MRCLWADGYHLTPGLLCKFANFHLCLHTSSLIAAIYVFRCFFVDFILFIQPVCPALWALSPSLKDAIHFSRSLPLDSIAAIGAKVQATRASNTVYVE